MIILLFLILTQHNSELSYAPNFSLRSLDNDIVVLDSLTSKGIVVVEFWATWCKCCVQELDVWKKLSKEFKDVTFVAINEDGPRTRAKVPLMVKAHKWEFLILYDENKKVMTQFQVQPIPHTFIVGKNRELLYQHIGFAKKDEEILRQKLKNMLPPDTTHTDK
ncbi:MAG: TlpA family protein disulfide reductase [Candidatus Stahlbacteria bacterium]|nr:TlpA family protein disulfide reductase [Candidatus Stahlbacteria bacterium]